MDSFREDILNLKNLKFSKTREEEFLDLISFVDATLGQAYKLSGDERANFLVTSLLSMRDYLKTEILTKSLSGKIVDLVLSTYDTRAQQASENQLVDQDDSTSPESKKNEESS